MTPQSHTTPGASGQIRQLVEWFFVLTLLEGILRKWVIPGGAQALIFLRDPLLLAIYAIALANGFGTTHRRFTAIYAALCGLYLVIVALQALANPLNPLIYAFGFRTYLMYVPLPFVMAAFLRPQDLDGLRRIAFFTAPFIGALIFLQYYSPPGSFWNKAPENTRDVFLLAENRVRPYGVFSFTLGHVFYALLMLSMFLASMFSNSGSHRRLPAMMLIAAAILAMGLFSGARTYFIIAPVILAFAALGALLSANWRTAAQAAMTIGLLGGLSYVAAALIFPDVIQALLLRQSSAVSAEGATTIRLLVMLTQFLEKLANTSALGEGAGLGTNIGSYLYAGRRTFALAEYELTRIVMEFGPFFGLVAIALRFYFVGWISWVSIKAGLRGNPEPLAYLGFLIPLFSAGPITAQNSLLSLGWLAVGMSLVTASERERLIRADSSTGSARMRFARQFRLGVGR